MNSRQAGKAPLSWPVHTREGQLDAPERPIMRPISENGHASSERRRRKTSSSLIDKRRSETRDQDSANMHTRSLLASLASTSCLMLLLSVGLSLGQDLQVGAQESSAGQHQGKLNVSGSR